MQKFSFRFILLLFFLFSVTLHVTGQESDGMEVNLIKQPLRFRSSYELLKMSREPDLGMLGMGADFFIVDKLPNLYFTINTYSAIIGTRPGLITFGTGAGYVQPLFRSPLSLDAGIFVGGGGGGGAPDGGGLITRLHLNLSYSIKQVSLFGGYSRLDFPNGDIGGNNFNVGLTLSTQFSTARRSGTASMAADFEDTLDKESKFRVQITGQNYIKFAGRPTFPSNIPAPKEGEISLVGIELDHFFHNKWYAALKLHGAVAGGIDGYMSYLVGLGFEQALGTDRLTLDTQLLAGPSGGGGIASGGGGIIQGSVGLRALLGNAYGIKAAIGQTITPGGEFNGTLLELGLSKNFQFASTGSDRQKTAYRLKDTDRLHEFGFELLNRTYYPSTKSIDKNGSPYDRAFNLMGLVVSKKLNHHFDILGATYWAYQGSYGAYAEGLLGVGYRYGWTPSWKFRAQVLGGAAGGGGIDTGNGLVFQYSAGLAHQINQNWGFSIGAGQMVGVKGNFKPIFTDIGIIYRFATIQNR
ncbi:MAG: hypothetical protein LLF81_00565 [Porphyromonadaceae bacterium]|nr:hypothetical protein [Porphyromonadaceae bacterium]